MARRTKLQMVAFRQQQAYERALDAIRKEWNSLEKEQRELAERERVKQERIDRKNRMIRNRIGSIISLIRGMFDHIETFGSLTETDISDIGRDISSSIKDLPTTHSGLISWKALANCYHHHKHGLKKYYPTEEHFNPNQVMGVRIVRHFLKKGFIEGDRINIDPDLLAILEEATRVHHVTYQENLDLREHQKEITFVHWKDAYDALGIGDLLEWSKEASLADMPTIYPKDQYPELYYD